MTEHLLDRHQVHAPLIIAGGAGVPQRVRAEPAQPARLAPGHGRSLLQLQQAGQPVADRAAVDPAAALVTEQRRPVPHPRADLIEVPAQDQVQPVQHRHPPRPRPGGLSALAEPHVQLAERAAAEMDIRPVQHRRLISSQPGQIQRPEQRVIPAGGGVLARTGDPFPQKGEELFQPLRRRRRARRRGVRPDMPRGIELIDRIGQADPERGLDRGRLARHQERVEVLEHLHIQPAGRGRQPLRGELADHPVHVLPGHLPGWPAASGQEPRQRARPVADRHLAESPRDLRDLESPQALLLKGHRVRRRPDRLRRRPACLAPHDPQPGSVHLPCSPLKSQGVTLLTPATP